MITHPSSFFFYTHNNGLSNTATYVYCLLMICCHGDVILSSFLGENDLSSKYKQWVWNRDLCGFFFFGAVPLSWVYFVWKENSSAVIIRKWGNEPFNIWLFQRWITSSATQHWRETHITGPKRTGETWRLDEACASLLKSTEVLCFHSGWFMAAVPSTPPPEMWGWWGLGNGVHKRGVSSYYIHDVEVCVCIHGLMCGFVFLQPRWIWFLWREWFRLPLALTPPPPTPPQPLCMYPCAFQSTFTRAFASIGA